MQNGPCRVKKPNREEAGGNHEDRKFDAFIEIESAIAQECGPQ
jgi:hypothetical protein